MIIMFVIAATTSVGAVATLYMASSYCIDACCRLRLDRISKRDKANAWNARLGRRTAQVRLLLGLALHGDCCLMFEVTCSGSDANPAEICQCMSQLYQRVYTCNRPASTTGRWQPTHWEELSSTLNFCLSPQGSCFVSQLSQ